MNKLDMIDPERREVPGGEEGMTSLTLVQFEEKVKQRSGQRGRPGQDSAAGESIIVETDPQTGRPQLVEPLTVAPSDLPVDDSAELTSTQVSQLAHVDVSVVNYLRREEMLSAHRPETASRSKRDGYLYEWSDVRLLQQAQRLGMGKTFTDSVRTLVERDTLEHDAGYLLGVLCKIHKHLSTEREMEPLLGQLQAAIVNLHNLNDREKRVLLASVNGRFPEGRNGSENVKNRRSLQRVYAMIGELLITMARLAVLDHEAEP